MAQKDAWRAYYELALGFTDTSRKKAMKIIKNAAGKRGVSSDQLQELVNTAMANREAMSRMVKVELDRALGRVGLATMDEVDELTKRVRDLERELREAQQSMAANAEPAATTGADQPAKAATKAAGKTTARKTAAKKTVAKKTVAKKAAEPGASEPAHTVSVEPAAATSTARSAPGRSGAAKKAPAKKATAKKTTAATTTAKKATAKKSAAKKTTAKKTTARRAPAKKTASNRGTGAAAGSES